MRPQKIAKLITLNKDRLKALAGAEVSAYVLKHIADVYGQILGTTSASHVGLIYQSILHLLYTIPDETTIIETFRKVAANDKHIYDGFPIPLWKGEPVKVTIGVSSASSQEGRTTVFFRVLSGLPAGMLMAITAPDWWFTRVIRRKLGLYRTPYNVHPTDISGCSFSVRLSVVDKKVIWDNITATPKQKEKNRGLIHVRYESRPCGSPIPCYKCRSTRRQCPCAVL